MADLLQRLRECAPRVSIQRAAADEIERLREESHANDELRDQMGTILTGVANALKGAPEKLSLHSWHDLVTLASSVVAERDALRRRIDESPSTTATRVNGRGPMYLVSSIVPDSWHGKRVRLVVEGE